jgi:hypothetical protein
VKTFQHPSGGLLLAEGEEDGIPINPELPDDFDTTPNAERPPWHMWWMGVPYIVTQPVEELDARFAALTGPHADAAQQAWERNRLQWMAAWPGGTRYEVRCLDGGASARP